jgi:hypothetical protein
MSVIELWDGTDRDAPTQVTNTVTCLHCRHLVPYNIYLLFRREYTDYLNISSSLGQQQRFQLTLIGNTVHIVNTYVYIRILYLSQG